MTRPSKDAEAVRDLLAQDLSIAEVARRVGVSRRTVRSWASTGFDEVLKSRHQHSGDDLCPHVRDVSESTYAYLLGLYLGDGHLTKTPRDVYKLRIYQDNKYPFLIHQCKLAMSWTLPNVVGPKS